MHAMNFTSTKEVMVLLLLVCLSAGQLKELWRDFIVSIWMGGICD